MNVIEQFKGILAKVENEELKGELNEALTKVEGVFNDAIASRDKAKEANKSLKGLQSDIASLLELEEGYTAQDIQKLFDAKSSNDDIEELKAKLQAKYDGDMNTLRDELSQKDGALSELQAKYNDTLFNSAITNSGLLDGFVDEPMARQNIVSMIKDQLLYEDGKVYVKDSTTGEKAMDIKTNEPLSVNSVIDSVKGSINPMYLKSETNGGGGGTPPPNQARSTLKRSEMSMSEKGNYIKEHGNDAYLSLPN